jgi:hypothetical protein
MAGQSIFDVSDDTRQKAKGLLDTLKRGTETRGGLSTDTSSAMKPNAQPTQQQTWTPPEMALPNLTLESVQKSEPASQGYGPMHDLETGMATRWSGPETTVAGGTIGIAPGAGAPAAPAAPTEQDRQLAMLDQIYAQYQGMRGAPVVGMNKDIIQGIAGQQAAMRGVIGAMGAEVPGQEAARAGQMAAGQRYIEGLQKLQGEQAQLFGARRQAMADDEARMAQAEKSFDASRVIREVGKSPLSTGALSFAAGLVGALKGQAGDMSPNQILGEVDKAIERDVMNQQTEYSRMKEGIATRRTNFLDAMRMGASESEALAASTLASMDQHKRALEFAEQRITGAKEKGAIQQAISQLDMQRGKMKMDLDLKNAANYVAMNKARLSGMADILQARQKLLGMDPETRDKAVNLARGIMDDKFTDATDKALAVGNVRKLMKDIPYKDQKEVWDNSIHKILMNAASQQEARNAGKDGNALLQAMGSYVSNAMKTAYTQDQKDLLNKTQGILNVILKSRSGGSVTDGEALRLLLERDFSSYEGWSRWVDGQEKEARDGLRKYQSLANAADPHAKTIIDNVLIPATVEMDEYDKWRSSNEAVAASAKGGKK